jgi:hypothetical protein
MEMPPLYSIRKDDSRMSTKVSRPVLRGPGPSNGAGYSARNDKLLRHKSLTTTAMFYKKRAASALADGLKLLEAAAMKEPLWA